MNYSRIDDLKAVLCDPDGNVALDVPDADKAVIQDAIDAMGEQRMTVAEQHYSDMHDKVLAMLNRIASDSSVMAHIDMHNGVLRDDIDALIESLV